MSGTLLNLVIAAAIYIGVVTVLGLLARRRAASSGCVALLGSTHPESTESWKALPSGPSKLTTVLRQVK